MLNEVILMGRLTRDPELRYTSSNKATASYTLAVDRNAAKSEDRTDFINCVAWEKKAEFAKNHLHKGTLICVKGRLQSRNYEDKAGNKRTAIEVIVESHFFCDTKKPGEKDESTAPFTPSYDSQFQDLGDYSDGELPF